MSGSVESVKENPLTTGSTEVKPPAPVATQQIANNSPLPTTSTPKPTANVPVPLPPKKNATITPMSSTSTPTTLPQRNLAANLRASASAVAFPQQQQPQHPGARPLLRNITSSTGRPTYNGQTMGVPGIAYMALLVSPYKTPNSSEATSLVITIPPMANFSIRGLFYHPAYGSVTAAITPQPGAKQVLRRFLIGPQLVRTVIAKNTAALKSLSSNTAGYLAAGLVCGIPLYIVFTGSPVSIPGHNSKSNQRVARPVSTVTNLRSNESTFINSIQASSVTPAVYSRKKNLNNPGNNPTPLSARSVVNTNKKATNVAPSSINPHSLSASTPSIPSSKPNNSPIDSQKELSLMEELIAPETETKNTTISSSSPSTGDVDLFSISPDSMSMFSDLDDPSLLSDGFSAEFWNNLTGSGEQDSPDQPPTSSPLSSEPTKQNIPPSSQIHSVAALPTTGGLQYSPLKKIDLSGTVSALAKQKPMISNELRKALNASSPAAYIPPPVEQTKQKKVSTTKKPRPKKRNTTPDWSVIDKALFQKGLIRFGTAFGPIAAIITTKSSTHVKRYYHENGGAKGYFKTLLNEHHFLKRQGMLETFDTALTMDEKRQAVANDGLLTLSLSYMNNSKKRKRTPNTMDNLPGRNKKAKFNEIALPVIEAVDPTANMSQIQRRDYINLKAEAIFAANDRKDFSTPKQFEDHLFPSGPSSGVSQQDLDVLVHNDYSLQVVTDQLERDFARAMIGDDKLVEVNATTCSKMYKSLQPKRELEHQPFYCVTFECMPPSASVSSDNDGKPPPLQRSASVALSGTVNGYGQQAVRHSASLTNVGDDNHHEIIPPLYLDVALSSHSDLTDISSSLWSTPSTTPHITDLHASAPTIPNSFQHAVTAPPKAPIFGKQGLFNFSHCANLFQQSETSGGHVNHQSTSPTCITIPRTLVRPKSTNSIENDTCAIRKPTKPKTSQHQELTNLTTTKFFESFVSLWPRSLQQSNSIQEFLYSHYNTAHRLSCVSLHASGQICAQLDSSNVLTQTHACLQENDRSTIACSTLFFDGEMLHLIASSSLNVMESSALNPLLLTPDACVLIEICAAGQILAVGVQNKIVLYDLTLSGEANGSLYCIKELQEHSATVLHLLASPCGPYRLASVDIRGCVRIWDTTSSPSSELPKVDNNHFDFKDHPRTPSDGSRLLWSSSGVWLASYDKKSVTLFFCKSNQRNKVPLSQFSIRCPKEGRITSVCFSPSTIESSSDSSRSVNTEWILLATENGEIFFYNLLQERSSPFSGCIATILSAMVMVNVEEKFLLYGIECSVNSDTHEREDSLLVFTFTPHVSESPLTLLQRYNLKEKWAVIDTERSPRNVVIADCVLQLGDTMKTVILKETLPQGYCTARLINLIPETLHKFLFPAPTVLVK